MYFVRWEGQGGGTAQGRIRSWEHEIHLSVRPILMGALDQSRLNLKKRGGEYRLSESIHMKS